MSFDTHKCWDCPTPVLPVLMGILGGLAVLWVGLVLVAHHSALARVLGGVIVTVAVAWSFLLSIGIWRFGVLWVPGAWFPPDRPALWKLSRTGDAALILVWYALATLIVRRHRNRARTVA